MSRDFPQYPAPVPLKLMVPAGAEEVEHDATKAKFSELILHKGLILFLCSIYPWLRLGMPLLTKIFRNSVEQLFDPAES